MTGGESEVLVCPIGTTLAYFIPYYTTLFYTTSYHFILCNPYLPHRPHSKLIIQNFYFRAYILDTILFKDAHYLLFFYCRFLLLLWYIVPFLFCSTYFTPTPLNITPYSLAIHYNHTLLPLWQFGTIIINFQMKFWDIAHSVIRPE